MAAPVKKMVKKGMAKKGIKKAGGGGGPVPPPKAAPALPQAEAL